MRRLRSLLFAPLFAAVVTTAGCSQSAYADRIVAAPGSMAPRIALAVSPAKVRAPYDVQVIREGGDTLPTYAHRDRFYVQGNANERYIIRITNPTANRVEAVVTVDGLDVVDGENGDLRKRGYVVPPYGETRIEGFRTSHADVATFRFSSVDDSYAGKKGKARNVGVIAVALFEEQAPEPEQQIIVGGGGYGGYGGYRAPYDYEADLDEGDYYAPRSADKADRPSKSASRTESKKRSVAPTTSAPPPAPAGAGRGGAPAQAPRHIAPSDDMGDSGGGGWVEESAPPVAQRRERPGLGTEFGEQRYSAASFTKFVRAANRPIAIAELRYNDFAGLMALGVPVAPLPDEGELMTRETADPFPGDGRFARPPGY